MLLDAVRERNAPAGALARVLAGWLVVVLVVQSLAALQMLARGTAHRHVPALMQMEMQVDMPQGLARSQAQLRAHWQAHQSGEPHHHAVGELAVPADAEPALDAGACALMASLAALWPSYSWPVCRARGPYAAMDSLAFSDSVIPPPRRPPRA